MLIVLTGRTAAGKDTIQSQLLQKYSDLKKIITTTSRPLRTGERNGVNYFFLSEGEFRHKISQGEFVEYVEYGGNLYGTYKSEIDKALDQDSIWRIDPSRAGQVRDLIKQAFPPESAEKILKELLVIFITCDEEVILQRLKERNLPEEEISKRMRDDQLIWDKYQQNYDHVIENMPGKLDRAVEQITQLIETKKTSL